MTAAASIVPARRAQWFAAACAVLFALLAGMVLAGWLTPADTRGILALRAYASPGLTQALLVASLIAHGQVAIPVALAVLGALYLMGRRRDALRYFVACAGGECLMLALKEIVHHHRPVHISPKLTDAGWYSFPSGHAMLAVIIFGLGAVLLTRRSSRILRVAAVAAAGLLVVAVAISRVYLGAHWPSDVVGAVLAGLGWSAVVGTYGARGSDSDG